jgi:mono/diheme cytochrome c family protein
MNRALLFKLVPCFALLGFCSLGFSGEAFAAEKKLDLSKLPPAAKTKVDFVKQIQPIFKKTCYSCHGPEEQESDLRLDNKAAAMLGGAEGKVIIPGKSAESRLIHAVAGLIEDGQMPPDGEGTPLSKEQVSLLRAWIDQGADWPASADVVVRKGADHWAFQTIKRPAVPKVKNGEWVRNPIDAFVLARLEKEGIAPSPEADRVTLMRRLYLDLLGLPPSIAEVDAFLADKKPGAYERLVDRVLQSKHYGERWGRHWLDLARYADSDGYEKDKPRAFAYRYRDWVIDALNADMPFDQFSLKQIAGDMLPEATPADRVASGFHRNTLHNTEGGTDREEDRVKKTVDRTNTFGTIWLGTTVGCAQCHTHKYDPITHREYFSLYAFFNSMNESNIDAPISPGNKKKTKAQTVSELGSKRQTKIHIRGNFLNKGALVNVSAPAFLPTVKPRAKQPDRLDLARWLFDTSNPLTARVTVNRIWQRYFGRGIVATVDDFGTQGERPSHPGLLDWLAVEFREQGWGLKKLHKLIVTSATYRQSSHVRPKLHDKDSANVLLARQTRRRVEAEIVRDLALSASGLLAPKIGGPSVRPPQPSEYSKLTYAGSAKWQTSKGEDRYRRGLYTFFQRTSPYPMLMTFDSPESNVCTAKRSRSNTPLQALTLWNDVVFFECAQALGRKIVGDVPASADAKATLQARAKYAFRRCLAREPDAEELAAVIGLYEEQFAAYKKDEKAATAMIGTAPIPKNTDKPDLAGWVMVGRVLLTLDEFLTKE